MSAKATNPRLRSLPVGGSPGRDAAGSPPVPAPDCERLWSAREVSEFLGIPVSTLHQWRYLGRGPAAFRVGKHLRYDPEAVRRWLAEDCAGEPA